MRANVLTSLLLCNAALAMAGGDAAAQTRVRPILPRPAGLAPPPAPPGVSPAPAPAPAPATDPNAGAGAAGAPGATPPPTLGPDGKPIGTTKGLVQFEPGIEYEPRPGQDPGVLLPRGRGSSRAGRSCDSRKNPASSREKDTRS